MLVLRTGIDLVDVERFENLKPEIRQRFASRICTQQEIDQIGESLQRLAGRFAAKEAVAKALGCGIGPISWREIEVLSGPEGEPRLVLHGKAKEMAGSLGLSVWAVSISHTHRQAAAVAVAASGAQG